MSEAGSINLPAIGQPGRLHVAGRSVPVEVIDHVADSLLLDVTEDGWTLTDGEARLICDGEEGAGLIAGSVIVKRDGTLHFTPGKLTAEAPARADGAGADGGEIIDRRGRGETPKAGHERAAYRVDLFLDVVVLVDGRELPAQTLNISPTGCLMRGEQRPLTDAVITVRLPVEDDRRLQLRGRVIRVEEDRYAVQFLELDATQDRALSRLIAKRQREILRRR